ncbi:MAG: HesA/MoeB/ThiF family protein [Anaerolineae bacterium]
MAEARYDRHVIIPSIGEAGQEHLREARVLVVGAGGLGSPVLYYLAAMGVGQLGIADDDVVSLSNLNRQILYTVEDVGQSKAQRAAARLRRLNPEVEVTPHEQRVRPDTGPALIRQYDLVVEASDNLETKDLVNALCVEAEIPLVWGAVQRFEGQMSVTLPGHACRRCIFPTTPEPGTYPTPAELGVLGATPGVIGALQAVEAVKVLLDVGEPLCDRLLLWDGMLQTFDLIRVERDPTCPVCGGRHA